MGKLYSIIRADGNPGFAMKTIVVGAIINIIFDPIAIFVLHMGIKGAAYATIGGQIISCILGVTYLSKSNNIKLNHSDFKLSSSILGKTLPLGISSFLTQVSIVVSISVMNNIVVYYGANSIYGSDIPLTVTGIVFKVFQIVIAFAVGVAVGAQPIVGYNYGAGKYERVKEVYKLILLIEFIIGVVSMLIFEIFPVEIISLFGSENELYNNYAVLAFRIYLFAIILTCIQKGTSIFLQSMGKPLLSMGLSLLRDFILLVPLIIILPKFNGVVSVLYSAPISDIVSLIATIIFMIVVIKEMNRKEKGVNLYG